MKKFLIALSAVSLIIFGASVLATVPSGDTDNMNFSEHGTYARLDEYYGTNTKINVPKTYNGLPVTTIGADAFNDENIERIYLPITTTTVETNAFINCGDQVHVVLELQNELADVPKDVANWGLGEYTARIRNFTATGRSDLFIEKGELEIGDCSNIKRGIMTDLIFESNLDNDTAYTGITYTKDKTPPADAYDISLGQFECSRGEEKCVQMWAEGTEIYITFCGDRLYLEDDVGNYYTSTCGLEEAHQTPMTALADLSHISGLEYIDTSKVTSMWHMFCQWNNDDPKITRLDLSNFDTSSVTDMNGLFLNMKLEEIDLSSFDTSNVNDMSYMFSHATNLSSIDLSSFEISQVNNLDFIFYKDTSLETVYVKDSATEELIRNSYYFPTHTVNFVYK